MTSAVDMLAAALDQECPPPLAWAVLCPDDAAWIRAWKSRRGAPRSYCLILSRCSSRATALAAALCVARVGAAALTQPRAQRWGAKAVAWLDEQVASGRLRAPVAAVANSYPAEAPLMYYNARDYPRGAYAVYYALCTITDDDDMVNLRIAANDLPRDCRARCVRALADMPPPTLAEIFRATHGSP